MGGRKFIKVSNIKIMFYNKVSNKLFYFLIINFYYYILYSVDCIVYENIADI